MRSSAFFTAAALLCGECTAQWSGYRTLSFNPLASDLDINNLGGSPLISFAHDSLWIGAIKQTLAAEPFMVALPKGAEGPNMEFISFHAYDFEQQYRPYVELGASKPIQFVNPYNVPQLPPANTCTWAQDASGNITQSGLNKIYGCRNSSTYQNTYQLFWLDDGIPKGYNCTKKLFLNPNAGCTLIG